MDTRFFLQPGLLVGLLLTSPVVAQTQLDLRSQSKNVDFSTAASTRPVKTGFDLPTACSVGDLFFRSSSTAGKNLYGCTAGNTWSLQAETISPAGVANFVLPFTNQTTLAITGAMHGFDSPNILVACFDAATPSNAIAPSGIAIDSTTLNVTVSFSSSRTGRCVLNAPGTAYTNGIGLTLSGQEFSVDPATVPSFLRGQAALTSWSIPTSTCLDRTFELPGAALLDSVVPGWPANLPSAVNGTMLISEVGIVAVRLCNGTAAAVSVPASTFGAAILKSF